MGAPLEGYTSVTSAAPGEPIDFHVRATDSRYAHFTLQIYRRGLSDTLVASRDGDAFVAAGEDEARLATEGCGWPDVAACRIVVPADWASGYYVGRIAALDTTAWIPFFVRAATPGRGGGMLLKMSDVTAQAYTAWGGRSFYSTPHAPRISFDRPYDDLALFERYQLPFVRWAETNGIALDVCSSLDLHLDSRLLAPYRLFISLGHDEYWSLEMRDQVEAFVAAGGNACFLSANTCYWQVRFDLSAGGRIMICYKETENKPPDPDRSDPRRVTVRWYEPPVNRPENHMTGVSYRNGAGWWIDPVEPAQRYRGYTVTNAAHWVYAGTALSNGDTFGAGTSVDDAVLGYETDAALSAEGSDPPSASGSDGTPDTFSILATADLRDWAPHGQGGGATLGTYQRHGVACTAGTVNWAGGLGDAARVTPVARMTQNLLRVLARARRPELPVANATFDAWTNGVPDGWILDGAGSVASETLDADVLANQLRFTASARQGVRLDATAGDTWLALAGLNLDGATWYGAGAWVRAAGPGATLRLQTTDTWLDFASAAHSGNGEWEYLYATGSPGRSDSVPARVKLQVAAGMQAVYCNVAALPLFAGEE